jgi:type VI secretion system protein ImpF
MPRFDPTTRLTASLLDRLIDQEEDQAGSARGYDHRQMIDVVRRDLEDLLNTRMTNGDVPAAFVEVNNSVVTYGLPDLSSQSADTAEQRAEIGRIIERVIERFEPRLRHVRARLVESMGGAQTVRFQINAELNVDPAPEVGFETVLELMTGHASIKESAT